MIDLYGMTSPNVIKVLIMLEELNLPYRLRYVDIWQEEQYEPAFSRLSPTNKVPVIVDPDGPGGKPITIFESGAILLYLGEKTDRFLPADPRERIAVYEWLMVQMSLIGPMAGQAVHFTNYAPPGNDYAKERYYSQCARVHELLDKRLSESAYIAGDACTIADFATFPWLQHAVNLFPWLKGEDGTQLRTRYPDLARWYEAMLGHPGVAKAMQIVRDIRESKHSSAANAKPGTVDRFVLRGAYSAIPEDRQR